MCQTGDLKRRAAELIGREDYPEIPECYQGDLLAMMSAAQMFFQAGLILEGGVAVKTVYQIGFEHGQKEMKLDPFRED